MKIVFLGSGGFGLNCLNEIMFSQHSLELVVTQPAHRAGRGKKITPTEVSCWAAEQNVDFVEAENINKPEMIEKIKSCEPDLIVVIAFGQKISADVINIAKHKAINVHSSALPKYRGAAPINWAIINGETETGISIITLAEKMDAGQVLSMAETKIKEHETAGQLHDRLAVLAGPLLMKTIDQIENGTAVYQEQEHEKATLARKLKKSDGYLDFNEDAETLNNMIRGFWPWPEASADYVSRKTGKCTRVIIAEAEVVRTGEPKSGAGMLDENLNVICGKDCLKILKVKPAGKSVMDFKSFANGRATEAGDLFMKIEKCTLQGNKFPRKNP